MAPDRFFDETQQTKLADLMQKWRIARDEGTSLPSQEHAELTALVQAELDASIRRAQCFTGDSE